MVYGDCYNMSVHFEIDLCARNAHLLILHPGRTPPARLSPRVINQVIFSKNAKYLGINLASGWNALCRLAKDLF